MNGHSVRAEPIPSTTLAMQKLGIFNFRPLGQWKIFHLPTLLTMLSRRVLLAEGEGEV